ncbi:MAG: flagellar hook-basal body complex protein [Rhodocyclaceae bacterium]|nr:flagellar hook-basal body complex protein [Rhodocyclaceae bacterium]
MSFQQALTGINAASATLDTISNNIANAGTVGFKQSVTQFSDLYASALTGGSNGISGGSGQVGMGSSVSAVVQQFTQGNITTTNNPLDIAINGQGMFQMKDANGSLTYTRNGQFQLDQNGYFVNAQGLKLEGFPGTGSALGALGVTNMMTHQQTKNAEIEVNLNSQSLPPTAMTAGSTTGTASFVSASQTMTIAAGTNDKFMLAVDGNAPVQVSVLPGTYTGGQAGTLVSALQTAVDTALVGLTPSVAVTVGLSTNGKLLLTSNSVGAYGTQGRASQAAVSALAGNNGAVDMFGSTATGTALTSPLALTSGTNNSFTLSIDGGAAIPVTVPAGNYTFGNNSTNTLVSAVQNAIYGALSSVVPPVTSPVNVSIDSATGMMTLTGSGSLVMANNGANTGATTLMGSASVTTAYAPTVALGSDNFNPNDPTTYTSTTSEQVYDPTGVAHTLATYFCKTSQPNQWQMYATISETVNGQAVQAAAVVGSNIPTSATNFIPTQMTFTSSGALKAPGLLSALQIGSLDGTVPTFNLNMSKSTQNTLSFSVNAMNQDGYKDGALSGISVDNTGLITGSYSNGKSSTLGQLALFAFQNPSALVSVGNNQWQETPKAGSLGAHKPGDSYVGTVQSGAVEASNVDLTKELVDMIVQQRAYQADAQSIKTQDQIMQTIVSLR